MGAETLAVLGLNAAGQVISGIGASKDASRARKNQNQMQQQATDMMQNTPGAAESGLLNFMPYATSNAGLNAGQDALMQYLNRSPSAQLGNSQSAIDQIAGASDPFAPGGPYEALGRVNDRAAAREVAGLHASAGSLGARFGGANRAAEGNLRADIFDRNAAQRGVLGQQFQGLRLQAAQGDISSRLAAAQTSGQLGLSQLAQILSGMQSAGQLASQRASTNAQLFGLGHQPAAQIPGALGSIGSSVGDLGSLYYILSALGGSSGGKSGTSASGGAAPNYRIN